jgi:hypothetical protein
VVSSRELENVFNKHAVSLLQAFATMLLLTTSPSKWRKAAKTGEGGK